jgi:RNA polymerase sigma-70 factor (ECF subfamily)
MPEEISIQLLVNDYGPMVSSICRRMLQDPDTVQDASQQVWIEVIKGLPGFRGKAKISTWIYSIARRVILAVAADERQYSTRFLRGYFNSGDMELPSGEDLDKDIWVREMCDKCLTGMLHCLDNEARLVYIFRDVAGLSYGDIAQIYRVDEQTVRQIVSRTRKKLRNFLKDECALFNPKGTCRCRMSKWVDDLDLPQEYGKLRSVARSANVYLESEKVMPGKNYWLAYL